MRVPGGVTLGLIAGGRATRLGGIDKAWLLRDGVSQTQRWQQRFAPEVDAILASSNGDAAPFAALGIPVVADQVRDVGPIAGLDALAAACATQWLLTRIASTSGAKRCCQRCACDTPSRSNQALSIPPRRVARPPASRPRVTPPGTRIVTCSA